MDGVLHIVTILDHQLDGFVGTHIYALPAAPAGICNPGNISIDLDRIHKAHSLSAISTTQAILINEYMNPGKAVHLPADTGSDFRENLIKAAARAAVANCHQVFGRTST
jgi:hypothetical protein